MLARRLQATQQRLSSSETENNELKQKLARLEEEVELLRKELSESLVSMPRAAGTAWTHTRYHCSLQEIRKKLNADLEKEQIEVNSLASRILNEKQNTMMQMNEMSEMNASLQVRRSSAAL